MRIVQNPVVNRAIGVRFFASHAGEIDFRLYDNVGRMVLSRTESVDAGGSFTLPVPTEGLSPGVYFLKFSCGGATRHLKVVIAR